MAGFDAFVVFGEMRTGSNFLETNLNAIDGVSCYGEAFNPHFIGYPNLTELLGFSQAERDKSPLALLDAIRNSDGITGFRFFHDHDPRILDVVLDDRRIAKIILTRNPLDSYVSWKIAQTTGQWKLTNVRRRKAAKVTFDAVEFQTHLTELQAFQDRLLRSLQTTGQTAFYVRYEDLQSLDVINGLARYLGAERRLDTLDASLKVQNPGPLKEKVSNFAAMTMAVAAMGPFDLERTPNFEPKRAAAVPNYVAAVETPLLYLPIKGAPSAEVEAWMAALDGVASDALLRGFNQKSLRQWKRQNKGHRSFSVLRHPVARAHHVFCRHIVGAGAFSYEQIRMSLIKHFGLPVSLGNPDEGYDLATHKEAFLAYLNFVEANLAGQTAIRVDGAWSTQAEVLRGFGQFALPDRVIREADLRRDLQDLVVRMGCKTCPDLSEPEADAPHALEECYDETIEKRVARVYQRDYMMFGFKTWVE